MRASTVLQGGRGSFISTAAATRGIKILIPPQNLDPPWLRPLILRVPSFDCDICAVLQGEGDRHIPDLKPKHLFSGERLSCASSVSACLRLHEDAAPR